MAAAEPAARVSTGLPGLDAVLDGLRIGDNVVWRVDEIDDYRHFVQPFVSEAAARRRSVIYVRFGAHPPLIEPGTHVRMVELDALQGFEAFTREVYELVTDHGRGAFYVFDCLSDLLSAWATDVTVGNLFEVVCPRLYELDTVAYFALLARRHSFRTTGRIRETTQVLVDVRRTGGERYVQPVKAWRRRSPTMFLPHREREDDFEPVVDSSSAARLEAAFWRHGDDTARELDHWDRLFREAAEMAARGAETQARADLVDRLCRVLMGRDERVVALARRYLTLDDLVGLRQRMIGSGFIGGKAAGMLLARRILTAEAPDVWASHLDPNDSFFVGTDVYYSWLVHNGWWPRIMRQRTAEGYFEEAAALYPDMLAGRLPEELRPALERMLDYFGQYPILVRSSSMLEDGFGNAFAGKYESIFCVNQGTPEHRLAQLEQAICRVFASTMSEDALVYRRQRGLEQMEEPMALLLQRVNGRYHGRYYLPDAAGVAVSRNIFAWAPDMDPKAGMVRMVMGLGTRAVDRLDGDHACVIALDQPHRRPYREEQALRFSQHDVDVLDITDNRLCTVPLRELARAAPDLPLAWCAARDEHATEQARALGGDPVWRVSFRALLDRTPFADLMRRMLSVLEREYAYPVDVEYTLHVAPDGTPTFNVVQCRPLQTLGTGQVVDLPAEVAEEDLLFATEGHFMGGSIDQPIARVIKVNTERYARLATHRKHAVARLIGHCTRRGAGEDGEAEERSTLLIGPGRWGSSSPELGVPIRFADISRVAVLVEVAEMEGRVEPDLSFGSHFFQDLVEAGIAYVALSPRRADCRYNASWLAGMPADRQGAEALEGDVDRETALAVAVYDVRGQGLRVRADVRSQRLLCYRTDASGG
jgi:pyruvate, water dikinase